jgi:GMP synthase (glutamine-hydrolysing)|tara:strand:+ start:5564 stop:6103 length:540 start_codon:yes stop_codon:yes gene_type:complete
VSVLLVSTCVEPLSEAEFVAPLERIVRETGATVESVRLGMLDGVPEAVSHILLAGTALQDDQYLKEIGAVKRLLEAGLPLLAVCSGMQLLAAACGGKIIAQREIGMVAVETLAENPLCASRFEAFALHRHAVEPGARLEVLARSEECAQVVRHRELPAWGVLFHPEVRNEQLVRSFLAL